MAQSASTDFKATVNPQLKVDQFSLPRIDDILASLSGGKHFSMIDLRSAYLQMEMDDESKSLLTLNTHKGLYRLNRLAFGIASAPAMWQRVIDQLISGFPKTQCIIDDIIVTGETDDEHLRNLEMVLQRLLDARLLANPAKTRFMWQVMPHPTALALFFLTACLTKQSSPSPLLLAR